MRLFSFGLCWFVALVAVGCNIQSEPSPPEANIILAATATPVTSARTLAPIATSVSATTSNTPTVALTEFQARLHALAPDYDWPPECPSKEDNYSWNEMLYCDPQGNITGLSFRIDNLGSEISQFKYLQSLYLTGSDLATLPPEIGQLSQLETLYLDGTHLTELPSEIGKLSRLRRLELTMSRLVTLPPEIGQLSQLEYLSVAMNGTLMSIPPEIGHLDNLVILYLSGNQLREVPSEIGELYHLQELYLAGNMLATLPPEIGQLTNLQYLGLDSNQLTSLPPEICTKLGSIIDPPELCQ